LCSDKKILRDGTEEYVDFNKRGRYMLIMPEKLKKLYIHYQFTEVMLRIACKRSLLRKVELIPEPRSRRCRKLRFIES
jgi:hypothetical protein